jgi:hypothetical protein
MKRFTVLGLCFVTALVFSVFVAASAQAKSEHGELYVTSAGGEAHLGTEKGSITSSSNSGVGHLTSATAGTANSTFNGVEAAATKTKCNSAGQAEGVVKTLELSEEPGWIAKPGEAGVDFKPASGLYLAEFECGALKIKVKGSVIGHVTPLNTSALSSKLNLIPNKTGTANSPESFEGGPKDILETEFNAFPGKEFESLQQQENVTVTNHGNASVCKTKKGKTVCKPQPAESLYTINGTPMFGRCDKQKGKFSDSNCTAKSAKGKFEFVPLPG